MKISTKLVRKVLMYSVIVGFPLVSLYVLTNLAKGPTFIPPAPYPASPVIDSISWDFDNLIRLARGSDSFSPTWAADGNLYTGWGDGTGFGNGGNGWVEGEGFVGYEAPDRVGLGFARIEGNPDNLREVPDPSPNVFNVWGGQHAENPAQFSGKPTSLLSIDGVLYAWLNNEDYDPRQDFILSWSTDFGATWTRDRWIFRGEDFGDISFLQFGQDYQGARDGFVYMYGTPYGEGDPAPLFARLARVPKDQLRQRDQYQFFAGFDPNSAPIWTRDLTRATPVFKDPAYIGGVDVSYNPGIQRYILTTKHGDFDSENLSNLGVFDAPNPWGPWTTVQYVNDWGNLSGHGLGYCFPTKWISADGITMWVVFSGWDRPVNTPDSFNLVKATLVLKPEVKDSNSPSTLSP